MLDQLAQLSIPFAAFLLLTSFLYASLGRLKIYHFQSKAKLVTSGTLSYLITNSFVSNMGMILNTVLWAVGAGVTGAIILAVAIQRGKTKEESIDVIDQ